MLQLDVIKRHILPKKYSQRYEMKIFNSKKCEEQLNLTRSSIKNIFFEITKEFKEFKFRQNLRIEFTKNDEAFRYKIIADPWFDSEKLELSNTNLMNYLILNITSFHQALKGGLIHV